MLSCWRAIAAASAASCAARLSSSTRAATRLVRASRPSALTTFGLVPPLLPPAPAIEGKGEGEGLDCAEGGEKSLMILSFCWRAKKIKINKKKKKLNENSTVTKRRKNSINTIFQYTMNNHAFFLSLPPLQFIFLLRTSSCHPSQRLTQRAQPTANSSPFGG